MLSAGLAARREPRSMRDGNTLIGWGMATSTYPTHRMPACARVRVGANGTALVQCRHAGYRHRHLHRHVADCRRYAGHAGASGSSSSLATANFRMRRFRVAR